MPNNYVNQIFVSEPVCKGGRSSRYRFDGSRWVDVIEGRWYLCADPVDGWPTPWGSPNRVSGHFEEPQVADPTAASEVTHAA